MASPLSPVKGLPPFYDLQRLLNTGMPVFAIDFEVDATSSDLLVKLLRAG